MSVISGGKTIFCEGKESSLDYRFLNRLVEDISGDRLLIDNRLNCCEVNVGESFLLTG
ncbi:MAG: hypothetical protein P5702_01440 [Limnospira sp. PMC 1291.21]|uniref:Uncharacterized protein n=2 Tax=Limnospira TaxID=2596745 RepID=B5VZ72_LIMMA|nr:MULTISPECIES: hypothetical protein [Limnospira]EKD10148.1 hypothetical protein SPLC1_S101780 [Arthrospira platensis C1]MDC0839100.1 hypothetical protein [Limnoraphis robusta]MDY7052057.1 hypothetical protein [Limnospira fusiformis LS22]EDZ95544.1 hypothetical protein AmaxDRAFT_1814 [Limnospira maxima CS-328]MDT9176236.1 hypothetical protein [Limnospira sp. PMC 1238.20]